MRQPRGGSRLFEALSWGLVGMLLALVGCASDHGHEEALTGAETSPFTGSSNPSGAIPTAAEMGAPAPAPGSCAINCEDFLCQEEAQDFFLALGGPGTDVCDLDRDNDGTACDTTPSCGPSLRGCCSRHGGVLACQGLNVVCMDGTFSPSCRCQGSRVTRSLVRLSRESL